MSRRLEFVALALNEGCNVARLCRAFHFSRKTGYKWIRRFKQLGPAGVADCSRRPHHSPRRSSPGLEALVLDLRKKRRWGGRKIAARLEQLPVPSLIHPSTASAILKRHGLIDPFEAAKHRAFIRFERPSPNDLWQMDFKGHFPLGNQKLCHPLTILDDYSRFNIALVACADQQSQTVQHGLIFAFRTFGLPTEMLMDNGAPWGNTVDFSYTKLTVWLMQLGIAVTHGRPYHPQTQGKDERFHRTLKAELLRDSKYDHLAVAQRAFDQFRDVYNLERPHEALALKPPASRYCVSARRYPEKLPDIEYAPECQIRSVENKGEFSFQGHRCKLSKAFHGLRIGLRATLPDGCWEVFFSHFKLGLLDLRTDYVVRKVRRADIRMSSGETDTGHAGEQPAKG
jgi:transposase InsO family protein